MSLLSQKSITNFYDIQNKSVIKYTCIILLAYDLTFILICKLISYQGKRNKYLIVYLTKRLSAQETIGYSTVFSVKKKNDIYDTK